MMTSQESASVDDYTSMAYAPGLINNGYEAYLRSEIERNHYMLTLLPLVGTVRYLQHRHVPPQNAKDLVSYALEILVKTLDRCKRNQTPVESPTQYFMEVVKRNMARAYGEVYQECLPPETIGNPMATDPVDRMHLEQTVEHSQRLMDGYCRFDGEERKAVAYLLYHIQTGKVWNYDYLKNRFGLPRQRAEFLRHYAMLLIRWARYQVYQES